MTRGLYYPGLLKFTDALIVWDSFNLEERFPRLSENVTRFFVDSCGPEKIILSIGLSGKERPVSADELSEAAASTVLSRAQYFWITPKHMVTPAHPEQMVKSMGSGPAVTAQKERTDGSTQGGVTTPTTGVARNHVGQGFPGAISLSPG